MISFILDAVERGTVQRLFGPSARIDGRMGSNVEAGEAAIHLDDQRVLGRGGTFCEALVQARNNASRFVALTSDASGR